MQKYITKVDEGYELNIDLNVKCGAYTVTGINMFVAADADEGCGDLSVSYDISNLQNDESARTAGMLLLRNMNSDDEVTQAMSYFYWDDMFTDELRDILAKAGFTSTSDVHTSEWGMQDEGRASYDAFDLADEIRTLMQSA